MLKQKRAVLLPRRVGRVVDCGGLENRCTERYRGFESLTLRKTARKPSITLGFLVFTKKSETKTRQKQFGVFSKTLNKKMSKIQNLIGFKPAALKTGKVDYIEYYVRSPFTQEFIRKRVRVSHIKSVSERKKYARELIQIINQKLYDGWNPLVEETATNSYVLLTKALQTFINQKQKELRPDSIRSYRSFLDKLLAFLKANKLEKCYCASFEKKYAANFMMELYRNTAISSKTWNNYLNFFRSLWNWMIENQYAVANPFTELSKKQQTKKTRIVIPHNKREEIRTHLEATDYSFMIATMLVFHCLLRPKEISMLKPSNFLLKEQVIRVPAEVSKNKHERLATIPNTFMPYLVAWNWNNAAPNEYIFGPDFNAGKTPICARRFAKKWDKLRIKMKLPMEMKLYSLRDSGIIQLLQDGVSPEEVMLHADHSSLAITSIYLKHAKPNGSEQIKQSASDF